MIVGDVRAVVIAAGPLRSPRLVRDLEGLGLTVDVVGVRAEDVPWDDVGPTSRISRSEVACKAGHARAYALVPPVGWLLVCEDDAELRLSVVAAALGLLEELDPATPTVVSLYLGPWSVVRVADAAVPVLDCVIPPDGGVGYLINATACALAAGRWETVRPADWPLWARDCRFLVVPGGATPMADVPSLVSGDSTRHRRASRSVREAGRRLAQVTGAVLLARSSRGVYRVPDWWYWDVRQRLVWRLPSLVHARRSTDLMATDGDLRLS